jgi:hypothetical protein
MFELGCNLFFLLLVVIESIGNIGLSGKIEVNDCRWLLFECSVPLHMCFYLKDSRQ